MGRMGYVYIYRSGDGNVFKIGRSIDYDRRVKAHATGNPEPLTQFDVIETEHAPQCETYLHHRLRSKQSRRGGEGKEWFEVDPEELAAMIADARHYTEEVLPMIAEAEALAIQQCDERILEPTATDWGTYLALVGVREKYETLEFDLHRLEAQLKLAIGTASGMERVANWKTVSRHSFDAITFKARHPELYDSFARETHSRSFNLL
jgi:hypothetical protein